MESGFVSGQILTYQDGNDLFLRKRLGRLKYEDIVLTCGSNLSIPFYQWLAGTLSQQGPRKNGAIVAVNQNGQIIHRREIQNALVKEVEFPGVDAASNEPAYFKVTVTPERIRYQSASGQAGPPPQANHSGLSTSKFRLQIQGLEQACAFVQRIEPLVVKQEIINYVDGGEEQSRVRAGRLEVGNLIITLPQHQAGPFTAWFSSFVLQGQIAGNAKQGVIEFLKPDAQTVIAAVTLSNLGIFRMAPVTVGGSSQVQVEMYCETMRLTQFPGGSSKASHQPPPTQQKATPPKPKSRIQPRRKNISPRFPRKQ
jgi:phage tail-like protein